MTTAQFVIDRIRVELNDDAVGDYRYSDADLLAHLSTAQRELVRYKPEAYTRSSQFVFADTSARQRLSCDFYSITRVEACLDTDVVAPYPQGAPIRTVERDLLDSFYAAWAADTPATGDPATRYKVAATDASDPRAFWVFPRPVIGHAVQITAVEIPPTLTDVADSIAVSDVYLAALTQCACHVAMRNEELAASQANATKYLNAFLAMLGVTRATLKLVHTDKPRPPEATE